MILPLQGSYIMEDVELKLWTNGDYWIVATDPRDASDVLASTINDLPDYDLKWEIETREEVCLINDNGAVLEAYSPAEWCVRHGRGFLSGSI